MQVVGGSRPVAHPSLVSRSRSASAGRLRFGLDRRRSRTRWRAASTAPAAPRGTSQVRSYRLRAPKRYLYGSLPRRKSNVCAPSSAARSSACRTSTLPMLWRANLGSHPDGRPRTCPATRSRRAHPRSPRRGAPRPLRAPGPGPTARSAGGGGRVARCRRCWRLDVCRRGRAARRGSPRADHRPGWAQPIRSAPPRVRGAV